MADKYLWWQEGIIYQVYPRSFQDSNADGVGDLPGITRRLDYLKSINVDAIWLSPVYPSPMADFGYDVSDYCDIEPMFGTLEDFERLLSEAHARGLKVIMDFVPNHTSDQHSWFLESRSSRDNPRRDWYIWADRRPDGTEPNNWISAFGGNSWEWDEATGQYYFHRYTKEQPDLNWRNPEVRAAMFGAMRFWLDKGIDGFRVDAFKNVAKDPLLRDNPPNPDFKPGMDPYDSQLHIYDTNRPEAHDIIRAMRQVVDPYEGRMMIGEIYAPIPDAVKYYGHNGDEFQMVYNFQLIQQPWHAPTIRGLIEEYEAALPPGAWPNWVLGNHDKSRVASRAGRAQVRVAQMLLLTLRGTPTCYYGDEIGMSDVEIPPHLVQDPFERNVPGLGLGRDPERTPMQWDESEYAGFSTVEPWLPLSPDYREANVAAQNEDPRSLLSLFRALTALRRSKPSLSVGSYSTVPIGVHSSNSAEGEVLAYTRRHDTDTVLVALNLSSDAHVLDLSGAASTGEVLLSTEMDRRGTESLAELRLRPNEGVVMQLPSGSGPQS